MKSLDSDKKAAKAGNDAEAVTAGDNNVFFTANE